MQRLCKFPHSPGTFISAYYEMHRHKETDTELSDKLPSASSITITDTAINRKHHDIERIYDFADIFKFSQELLLILEWVNLTKFLTDDRSSCIIIGQESGIPVVQITGMEQTSAIHLHYPRHATVITAQGPHVNMFVLPHTTFGQPHISLITFSTTVAQDILGQYVCQARRSHIAPGKDIPAEMIFVEMTGKDINKLIPGYQSRHYPCGISPTIKDQNTGIAL